MDIKTEGRQLDYSLGLKAKTNPYNGRLFIQSKLVLYLHL